MKVAGLFCLLAITVAEQFPNGFSKNNPLELKEGPVFYSTYGKKYELIQFPGKEVRNILVPKSEYSSFDYFTPNITKHPTVYFNLYENGTNLGVHVLKQQNYYKIIDGSDTACDFNLTTDNLIYIASSDGIYTYNPKTETVNKFGNITEKFISIDKVPNKDEIYVLSEGNKIYKITEQGTVKTKIEGIEYAKDFILDLQEGIYYLGHNNNPAVLYKGANESLRIDGFNFDIKNPILSRRAWESFIFLSNDIPGHSVFFVVDGVMYDLKNDTATASDSHNTVPGLKGFIADFNFVQFYGRDGITMHCILADPISFFRRRSSSQA